MADRKRQDIGPILSKIAKMVRESKDPRATALAELKEQEDGDPFRILIGTILSQRTRDEKTTLATERLFRRFKTPEELARAKAVGGQGADQARGLLQHEDKEP